MKVPFYAAKNGSWVRSTPATDGETWFAGGMRDVLVALDVKTGKTKWCRDYPAEEETPLPTFGFVSSPLLEKDKFTATSRDFIFIAGSEGRAWIRSISGPALRPLTERIILPEAFLPRQGAHSFVNRRLSLKSCS